MTRLAHVVAVVVLALGLTWGVTEAQPRVSFTGSVQWTSASRVQLMTDSGVSVNLDVSRVDQSDYAGLRSGDRVRVVGYLAPDRLRFIAESLEPDVWAFPQSP